MTLYEWRGWRLYYNGTVTIFIVEVVIVIYSAFLCTPDIPSYPRYFLIPPIFPHTPVISSYPGYFLIPQICPRTPDISSYSGYPLVPRIFPHTPDISLYPGYFLIPRQVKRLVRTLYNEAKQEYFALLSSPLGTLNIAQIEKAEVCLIHRLYIYIYIISLTLLWHHYRSISKRERYIYVSIYIYQYICINIYV